MLLCLECTKHNRWRLVFKLRAKGKRQAPTAKRRKAENKRRKATGRCRWPQQPTAKRQNSKGRKQKANGRCRWPQQGCQSPWHGLQRRPPPCSYWTWCPHNSGTLLRWCSSSVSTSHLHTTNNVINTPTSMRPWCQVCLFGNSLMIDLMLSFCHILSSIFSAAKLSFNCYCCCYCCCRHHCVVIVVVIFMIASSLLLLLLCFW